MRPASSGTRDTGEPLGCSGIFYRERDLLDEGRTETAKRHGRLEIRWLVEFNPIVLVENDPARRGGIPFG